MISFVVLNEKLCHSFLRLFTNFSKVGIQKHIYRSGGHMEDHSIFHHFHSYVRSVDFPQNYLADSVANLVFSRAFHLSMSNCHDLPENGLSLDIREGAMRISRWVYA